MCAVAWFSQYRADRRLAGRKRRDSRLCYQGRSGETRSGKRSALRDYLSGLAQDFFEPCLAYAVTPVAGYILAQQAAANRQQYNDRYDSGKMAQDSSARLQHRKDSDLPPVPALAPGGDPDIWRPVQIDYHQEQRIPQEEKELQEVDREIIQEQKGAHPEWDWD